MARLFDAWTGDLLVIFDGHARTVRSVHLSGDGAYLLTASYDKTVRLWTTTGHHETTLEGHSGKLLTCSFSRDGKLVHTGGRDNTARRWDVSAHTQF